ncbi:hypothetical protein ACOSQ3_021139 [Xanthoceras sorbifolium]
MLLYRHTVKNHNTAHQIWISLLYQKVVGQVTKCKSALEVWTKLQNLYLQQSMAKILQLRQQLQIVKKGAQSVSDFVLKIKNIGDALSVAGEEVSERDLLLSLMHGVGHEYDVVVVLISFQRTAMSHEEAQFLLLMHEQRIDELNTTNQITFAGASAHFTANHNADKRDQRSGGNFNRNGSRGRGRGGRSGGRKLYCQLCTNPGYHAFQCYHSYLLLDLKFLLRNLLNLCIMIFGDPLQLYQLKVIDIT